MVKFNKDIVCCFLVTIVVILFFSGVVYAQNIPVPKVSVSIDTARSPRDVVVTLEILFILTVLTLAPSILVMMTSFTRVVVVLSLLRGALGTQQIPPTPVIVGFSLFLTFFVMYPTWERVYKEAYLPYTTGGMTFSEAYDKALYHVREFMFAQVRERSLATFLDIAGVKPQDKSEVPTHVLVPAFIASELQTAFEIGFLLYIPFIIIDMVISSILISLGMIMLPPVLISLPFKLLLFVMVDGWSLITMSLVRSFRI